LTRKAFLPLFSPLKNVETFAFSEEYGNFLGLFRLFRELRALKKWHAVIDLHNVLRTRLLTFLFRIFAAKYAILHKNRCKKRKLIRKNRKKMQQLPFVQDEYAAACARAGFSVPVVGAKNFSPLPELPKEISQITGEKNEKWLGIAPFAKHQAKIYPFEKTKELIRYFSEKGNVKIFLFGGKADAEILECSIYNNVYSLAGKLSLVNELQIMAHLDCMLSMDSANMHLANLVDTPVVSVWGATHPFAGFVSVGNVKNTVIQRDLACRPCSVFGNKPCWKGRYECMDIVPEQIINAIEKIFLDD
jgi:ADP-heptose:LPS heptosyltransferase